VGGHVAERCRGWKGCFWGVFTRQARQGDGARQAERAGHGEGGRQAKTGQGDGRDPPCNGAFCVGSGQDEAAMTPCQARRGDFAFLLACLLASVAAIAGRTRARKGF
jgi:hypothetical protein